MARPTLVTDKTAAHWFTAHPQWRRRKDTIARTFKFADFSGALAFVVRVGLVAEKHDHHPEIAFTWGRVRVSWTTHVPTGLSTLDLKLAEASDALV